MVKYNMLLNEFVKYIKKSYKHIKIWLLYGQVGAGKTTFVQKMHKKTQIVSPSFIGYSEYENILHIDEYFKQTFSHAFLIDYINSDFNIYVEWPTLKTFSYIYKYEYGVVLIRDYQYSLFTRTDMYIIIVWILINQNS